jgi:DNA-binding response OmpR family regulator
MLLMHGFEPIIATTGREGITLALERHPDLTLLDIRLPDIDGYAVFRRIRQDEWGKQARVLILTASESIENISKNIDLPIEHVLFKPNLSITELIKKIEARLLD